MTFEVELKFPLDDPAPVIERLLTLGGRQIDELEQWDHYLAHPCRDFAETDEALRIRATYGSTRLTYKGPLVDDRTKTRREIEFTLPGGTECEELLHALGFRDVRVVHKRRTIYRLEHGDRVFEVARDVVEGLGRFLEIETLAEEDDRQVATDAVLQLADDLGLAGSERRSYLSLLLAQDAAAESG